MINIKMIISFLNKIEKLKCITVVSKIISG